MKNTYTIDPAHSAAHFSIRHMMIANLRGNFAGVTGTVVYDPENPSATTIDAQVDVTTLSTNDSNRDAHVKGPDFLNVSEHPTMKFVSTRVESARKGTMKILGDFTLHGVTKEVELDVDGPSEEGKDLQGRVRLGASAATKIKRSDFGVSWNAALETGGIALGDDLKVELDIEMIKAAGAAA